MTSAVRAGRQTAEDGKGHAGQRMPPQSAAAPCAS
jgi:hypothetical protein